MADEKESDDSLKQQIDFLWEALKRYDFYISTTNFKSGLLVSFNTAVFGAILLKHSELISLVEGNCITNLVKGLLWVISLLSVASVGCVLKSISPNTKSSSMPPLATYRSAVFFGSVSTRFSAPQYQDHVKTLNGTEIRDDLAIQAWEVAGITKRKFQWLKWASRLILLGMLPFISGLSFLLIVL